ncbi:TauD/TfdA family dioxygenase [Massilia sp. LXY-6]|uniref:TauD/TfdA family dioxygenase n=1 Tax=Massilia sp. LXY-6 TaxID=3379823 RepID=UPI003EE25D52
MSESNVIEKVTASIDMCKAELLERGWTILAPDLLRDGPRAALAHFGRIIPQLNGEETYEVTLKPGFDKLPYSQSKNEIGPHTEAPVYDPPPKYLALHCHRQAQCGGGQTLLADGFAFHQSLSPDLQQWMEQNEVEFSSSAVPGVSEQLLHRARLLEEKDGARVFRFSYNQFHYGDVNPSESDMTSSSFAQYAGTPPGNIAKLAERFFYRHVIPVLIPEGSLLIWDNQRLMHARSEYKDPVRHLTRYWLS